MATKLVPYLFLYGRCEEALEFYKSIFGGNYEIMRNADTPFSADMPADAANRVMHASFTSDDVRLMASDGRDVKAVDTEAGNVSLALEFEDAKRAEQLFDALASGGTIAMPLEPAFWGGRFGMLTDKFGTEWLVTAP